MQERNAVQKKRKRGAAPKTMTNKEEKEKKNGHRDDEVVTSRGYPRRIEELGPRGRQAKQCPPNTLENSCPGSLGKALDMKRRWEMVKRKSSTKGERKKNQSGSIKEWKKGNNDQSWSSRNIGSERPKTKCFGMQSELGTIPNPRCPERSKRFCTESMPRGQWTSSAGTCCECATCCAASSRSCPFCCR